MWGSYLFAWLNPAANFFGYTVYNKGWTKSWRPLKWIAYVALRAVCNPGMRNIIQLICKVLIKGMISCVAQKVFCYPNKT